MGTILPPVNPPSRTGRSVSRPLARVAAALLGASGSVAFALAEPASPAPVAAAAEATPPELHWADASRGRPFSKDPSVIRFGNRYLMYYSLPPPADRSTGWSIGIAESDDLLNWQVTGHVGPAQDCDRRGLAAPAAWVHESRVHLFYQTYGNGPKDAICHAWSDDGVNFQRNPENPIFAPTGEWTVGRAIDAEVFPIGDRLFLYFATRDPAMKIQMVGVAAAPLGSDYGRGRWTQLVDGPILRPKLAWERKCIEAPSIMRRDGRLWMFYAGGYNNEPQQIGVAVSDDGVHWTRVADEPLVPSGPPGSWNSSESGHPGVFVDADGAVHLFYQANNDRGRTWYLSKVRLVWRDGRPVVAR